jgi:hypothetical protein
MAELPSPHSDDRLVGDLTYVLAVAPPPRQRATRVAVCHFVALEQRLREVGRAHRRVASADPDHAVHCALGGQNPLDYAAPTRADGNATCADIARLWPMYLGQRLAITTSGSHGRPHARSALIAFRETPALIRELTIRIEVGHISQAYGEQLAEDIRLVRRLWEWDLPALDVRGREVDRRRLQILVAYGKQSRDTALTVTSNALRAAGLSDKQRTDFLADEKRVVFKQEGPSLGPGHGIGVRGELFTVAADGTVHAMRDSAGQHRQWRSSVGLGPVTPWTGRVRTAPANE